MATHTQRAGHPWPFIAGSFSEHARINPEAWEALQAAHKHFSRTPTYALQSQDCEQRGPAVIDAAVKTLLAAHTS